MKKLLLLLSIMFVIGMVPSCNTTSTSTDVAHPFRGVNLTGGDMAFNDGKTTNPISGTNYLFVSNQDIDYLANKKVGFVRINFSWEAVQPVEFGPIPATTAANALYLSNLESRVAYATSKGMNVLVEPHSFARYQGKIIGSEIPLNVLSDFWTKMATRFKSNPKVMIGLGNEPMQMSTMQWYAAAQSPLRSRQDITTHPDTAGRPTQR